MSSPSPHAQTARNALKLLKDLASNLDGWNFTEEKEGVKLYNKTVESSSIPIVRGDVSLAGHEFNPKQIAAIATLPGARRIWDEKFDSSEVKKMYATYESLFWGKIKTPWPISPRDMSATALREVGDDECYVVMTSVQDDSIPPISGNVRANLIISGWKIAQTDAGIDVTYITQVDLAGSIPAYFLKNVQQQVPLCAGLVLKYAKDHGYPPVTTNCTAIFKSEDFNHAKREYTSHLDGEGECSWFISKKMYPNGIVSSITSDATWGLTELENGDSIIRVYNVHEPVTVKFTKA